MRTFKKISFYLGLVLMVLLILFYGITSFLILTHEADLVFHPHQYDSATPLEARPLILPEAENIIFEGVDGRLLHGYFVQSGDYCDENTIPVLFCHGNGGNCTYTSGWFFFEQQKADFNKKRGPSRFAMLTFDYRAYGYSEGNRSELNETAIYADARAARELLAKKVGQTENQVVLMGHSLGGGVVSELAQDGTPGLILCSTFDSVPDTAESYCFLLPAKLLMKNRFASAEKLHQLHVPVLQFHDPTDSIVPYRNGQRLHQQINEPKEFVVLKEMGHNYAPNISMREKIIEFLEKYAKAPEKTN